MRKFVIETGWVPKELDVYVDVDDVIDISHMRSKALGGQEEPAQLLPNDDIANPHFSNVSHIHCIHQWHPLC
ncbi:hypothetical protein Tco_0989326 [Tanacetum coccineum]|uniref:Uncharacterized protein n=1 Tax=Tanacetum coccineum TaxID=301880 RepID=A0ABQ5ETN4_9ASTR